MFRRIYVETVVCRVQTVLNSQLNLTLARPCVPGDVPFQRASSDRTGSSPTVFHRCVVRSQPGRRGRVFCRPGQFSASDNFAPWTIFCPEHFAASNILPPRTFAASDILQPRSFSALNFLTLRHFAASRHLATSDMLPPRMICRLGHFAAIGCVVVCRHFSARCTFPPADISMARA